MSATRCPGHAATVVVLYLPHPADIASLIQLAAWQPPVVVVVNGPSTQEADGLDDVAGLVVIRNNDNLGLARALNQGIETAIAGGADRILLLDQDSRPPKDLLVRLGDAMSRLERAGHRMACVAPVLKDRKSAAPLSVPVHNSGTLATSGSLIARAACDAVGPMWEPLFIDGIDHEWSFRARAHGFETAVVADAVMEHDMGELAVNVFGRFKPIHRSPFRHYFIVRNTLWLARRRYIPLRWRLAEVGKLFYRIPIYVVVSRERLKSARNIALAVLDGASGAQGRRSV